MVVDWGRHELTGVLYSNKRSNSLAVLPNLEMMQYSEGSFLAPS